MLVFLTSPHLPTRPTYAPRRAELMHDVLAAAAELTDCWPVGEHHRRSPPPHASLPTLELAHAV